MERNKQAYRPSPCSALGRCASDISRKLHEPGPLRLTPLCVLHCVSACHATDDLSASDSGEPWRSSTVLLGRSRYF